MAKYLFGEIVKEIKKKVDRNNNPYEYYIAGDHMDTDELHLLRRGTFAGSDVGPAFIRVFRPGQVLYGSRRTYLRKVAVADFEGITANTTFVLETKDETILLQRLLPFIMQSDRFVKHSIKRSKGSTNPYVLFSDLYDYEVDLPDIEKQRELADLLWAMDDTKKAYQKLITATDELVKSQFMEQMSNAKTTDLLLHHVTVLYGFPFNSKLFNTNEQGTPLLRIRDINTGFSDTYTTETASQQYIVNNGDCVVGMDGNFEIVKWAHGKAYLNQRVCKLTPNNICKEYMIHYLRYELSRLEELANSTTVKHLSARDIGKMVIPIPDRATQEWFESFSLQSDKSKFSHYTHLLEGKSLKQVNFSRLPKRRYYDLLSRHYLVPCLSH